jgi:hypothetical protein
MLNIFKKIKREFRKAKTRRKRLIEQSKESNLGQTAKKLVPSSSVLENPEFLIKRAEIADGEFFGDFGLNTQNSLETLTPNNINYKVEMSTSHYVVKVKDVNYSFSEEMVGVLISFDGSLQYGFAKQIIVQLKSNLESLQNKKAEIIEFIK